MLKHIPFYASLLNRPLYDTVKSQKNHVLVYGAIEVHDQGKEGCIASNKLIGDETGFNAQTVANAIGDLSKAGWVEVKLDDKNHRLSIKPLMTLTLESKGGYSPGEGGVTLQSNIDNNIDNNKKLSKSLTPEMQAAMERLYKGWLVEMVIDARTWLEADGTDRTRILDGAKLKCRLTPKRKQKITARLESLGFELCSKAVRNIGKSDFHKGIGPDSTGWKATIEWLFKDDEKIEEWANR